MQETNTNIKNHYEDLKEVMMLLIHHMIVHKNESTGREKMSKLQYVEQQKTPHPIKRGKEIDILPQKIYQQQKRNKIWLNVFFFSVELKNENVNPVKCFT